MINQVNSSHNPDIGLTELDCIYDLSTFGNYRFFLKVKTKKSPLILKTKDNDGFFDEDLLPKAWVKKGRNYLLILRI